MKTISDVIDEAAAHLPTGSDYAVAKAIEATKQDVSKWRRNEGAPNMYYCAKLADLTKKDVKLITAIVGSQWEKRPERRKYWRKLLKKLRVSLCILCKIIDTAKLCRTTTAVTFSH